MTKIQSCQHNYKMLKSKEEDYPDYKQSIRAGMKEAIVHPLPSITTEIHNVPIPIPGPDEVIIKVEVAGSNVKGLRLLSIAERR
jgi:hypothetical protein